MSQSRLLRERRFGPFFLVQFTGAFNDNAFKQAIMQQGKGFPLLWSHMQSEPIGLGRVEDAKDGLVVHGSLLMSDPEDVRSGVPSFRRIT